VEGAAKVGVGAEQAIVREPDSVSRRSGDYLRHSAPHAVDAARVARMQKA